MCLTPFCVRLAPGVECFRGDCPASTLPPRRFLRAALRGEPHCAQNWDRAEAARVVLKRESQCLSHAALQGAAALGLAVLRDPSLVDGEAPIAWSTPAFGSAAVLRSRNSARAARQKPSSSLVRFLMQHVVILVRNKGPVSTRSV